MFVARYQLNQDENLPAALSSVYPFGLAVLDGNRITLPDYRGYVATPCTNLNCRIETARVSGVKKSAIAVLEDESPVELTYDDDGASETFILAMNNTTGARLELVCYYGLLPAAWIDANYPTAAGWDTAWDYGVEVQIIAYFYESFDNVDEIWSGTLVDNLVVKVDASDTSSRFTKFALHDGTIMAAQTGAQLNTVRLWNSTISDFEWSDSDRIVRNMTVPPEHLALIGSNPYAGYGFNSDYISQLSGPVQINSAPVVPSWTVADTDTFDDGYAEGGGTTDNGRVWTTVVADPGASPHEYTGDGYTPGSDLLVADPPDATLTYTVGVDSYVDYVRRISELPILSGTPNGMAQVDLRSLPVPTAIRQTVEYELGPFG